MRAFGYWFVRLVLFPCVVLALWVLGWKHWSVVVGALILSEVIAYAAFGSLHNPLAAWVERRIAKRFPPRGHEDESPKE